LHGCYQKNSASLKTHSVEVTFCSIALALPSGPD